MEFTNPVDGGPVMATMSAFARLVPAGYETRAARLSDGMINVVVEGAGVVNSDLVLFIYSDRATQAKLSLWREQPRVRTH